MRKRCLQFLMLVFSSSAIANERAQLSCGPHQAEQGSPAYVALDSTGYPAVSEAVEMIQQGDPFETSVALKAIGDFMQMSILDLSLPLLAGACSYDMFSANECKGNRFFPGMATQASLSGTSLSFMSERDDGTQVSVKIANPDFDEATVTITKGSTKEVSTWIRLADGTETFSSQASNGDETAYTENPDCSGMGHVVRHNQTGLLTTNEFSWSSATDGFIFRYKICDHQGGDAGCHEGQI